MNKMKYLPILFVALATIVVSSCKLDPEEDSWEYYREWRDANNAWLKEQEARTDVDGTPYYDKYVPEFDQSAYVLIHFLNDRSKTVGNLSPLVNSTVDAKYIGHLYNDVAFDSSFLSTSPADSLFRFRPVDMIEGWQIAIPMMRVGDSCEVIIPYNQGYGSSSSGSVPPYSHLKFHIKVVDIPGYEAKP